MVRIINIRVSWNFIIELNSAVGCLYLVDVGSDAGVSKVYTASIFRVEVSRVLG
jgi:hypothetical protein